MPARRRALTDKTVKAMKATDGKRRIVPDGGMIGHFLRITPTGAKSYVAVARDPNQKDSKGHSLQVWATLGSADHLTVAESRERARSAIKRITAGLPPVEPPPTAPESFAAIADAWVQRHVIKNKLRTQSEIERVLARYILPRWASRPIDAIRRSDITKLMDAVEDENGARQADAALTIIGSIMRWHAARADDFNPPLTSGQRRTSTRQRARSRILSDDELKRVWSYCEAKGDAFSGLVMLAFLTGQRRAKLIDLKWSDIDADGTWHVRRESSREKGTGQELKLPRLALDVIERQPRFASVPFVFVGTMGSAFGNPHYAKVALDKAVKLERPWVLHDARRTCRSLLSRCGVTSEIAEMVIGHQQQGVLATYDRHKYTEEKAAALERLARLIESIINPATGDNVTVLKKHVDAR